MHSAATVNFLGVVKGENMQLKNRNTMWFEYFPRPPKTSNGLIVPVV